MRNKMKLECVTNALAQKTITIFILLLNLTPMKAQVDSLHSKEGGKVTNSVPISSHMLIEQVGNDQKKDEESSYMFNYEEVIPSPINKSIKWLNLKKWVSSSFNKYEYVVDVEDKDTGLMIIKWAAGPYHSFSMYTAITYHGTFQVDIRDDKYRIKIYDAIADTKTDNLNHMYGATRKYIKIIKEDLKKTKNICRELGSSQKWNLDSNFISVMNKREDLNTAMSLVCYDYEKCCKTLLESLKKAMSFKDDF